MAEMIGVSIYLSGLVVTALILIISEVRQNKHEKTSNDFGATVILASLSWPFVAVILFISKLVDMTMAGIAYLIDKLKGL